MWNFPSLRATMWNCMRYFPYCIWTMTHVKKSHRREMRHMWHFSGKFPHRYNFTWGVTYKLSHVSISRMKLIVIHMSKTYTSLLSSRCFTCEAHSDRHMCFTCENNHMWRTSSLEIRHMVLKLHTRESHVRYFCKGNRHDVHLHSSQLIANHLWMFDPLLLVLPIASPNIINFLLFQETAVLLVWW